MDFHFYNFSEIFLKTELSMTSRTLRILWNQYRFPSLMASQPFKLDFLKNAVPYSQFVSITWGRPLIESALE